MSTYKFLGDYPDNDEGDWTSSLQGVTHNDDGYWIFTQKTRIFKFHISEDLAAASAAGDPNSEPMPEPLVRRKCNHFGDPDYILLNGVGYLFVPVEGEDGGVCQDEPVIAVFRDSGGGGSLEFVDWALLPEQARAGWCAISPVNRLLYTSSNKVDSETPMILRYKIDFNRLLATDKLSFPSESELILRDKDEQPIEIKPYMQGGAFSPDGKLYIVSGRIRSGNASGGILAGLVGVLTGGGLVGGVIGFVIGFAADDDSWKARHGGIRVFDQTGILLEKSSTSGAGFKYAYRPGFQHNQEPEGITYWDTDQLAGERHAGIAGQLHGILLNKQEAGDVAGEVVGDGVELVAGNDNIWLKHYSVTPIPNGTSPPAFDITSSFCVNRNAQQTGEHEVHNLDASCPHLPKPDNRRDLGSHPSCGEAIIAASELYENVDGCAYCAPKCNTR